MRILYVAKHGQQNSNDDEGSIAFALEKLGHEVVKYHESGIGDDWIPGRAYDFCLFHKWCNPRVLKNILCPKVFWYFDLVDWPLDATLSSRCEARRRWMAEVTSLVDLGFMTDGDWVARDTTGKLRVLRQGADERVVGFGTKQGSVYDCDVLFVGGVKGCGIQRESFLADLQERYKGRLLHVGKGVYGRSLANLIASAKVVVCPDSPVTDRYWSNRVYVMAGFGACLLHPWVWDLNGVNNCIAGLLAYKNREEMFKYIDQLLANSEPREHMQRLVLADVQDRHLYRHRCEELVRVVKEQLGI